MFAVYAESFSSDDPLSGLVIGERPEPEVPDGWTTVTVVHPSGGVGSGRSPTTRPLSGSSELKDSA